MSEYYDNEKTENTDGFELQEYSVPDEGPLCEIDDEEYYELPLSLKKRSRLWSVLSFGLSILSILLCPFWYLAFPLAVGALVFAAISRRTLGYFDGLTVTGMIIGIIGAVFGVFSAVIDLSGILDSVLG